MQFQNKIKYPAVSADNFALLPATGEIKTNLKQTFSQTEKTTAKKKESFQKDYYRRQNVINHSQMRFMKMASDVSVGQKGRFSKKVEICWCKQKKRNFRRAQEDPAYNRLNTNLSRFSYLFRFQLGGHFHSSDQLFCENVILFFFILCLR